MEEAISIKNEIASFFCGEAIGQISLYEAIQLIVLPYLQLYIPNFQTH